MSKLQKLSGLSVLIHAALWAILLIVFFVVLPGHGFVGWDDFNNPVKVASARGAMVVIVWSDVLFGLAMLISVFVLDQHLRSRLPRIVRALIMIVLLGVILWFLGHDIGIHLIGWFAIERDPAGTNYAMDRVLWAFRNGVFFVTSLLIFLTMSLAKKEKNEYPQ